MNNDKAGPHLFYVVAEPLGVNPIADAGFYVTMVPAPNYVANAILHVMAAHSNLFRFTLTMKKPPGPPIRHKRL